MSPLAIAAASGMAFSVRAGFPAPLLDGVGQEREEAGALDRLGELALLLGRDRGDAARHDFAALGDEALQQLHVLVVDLGRIGARERAGFAPPEERPPCPAATAAHRTSAAAAAVTIAHASAPSLLAAGCSRGSRGSRGGRSSP